MNRHSSRLKVVLAAVLGCALLGFTAPATAAPPSAPVISYVETSGDASQTFTVSWPHVGRALDSYEIYYRPAGTSTWLWSGSSAVGADYASWVPYVAGQATYTRQFRIPNATANTAYEIGVKALDPGKTTTTSTDDSFVKVTTTPQLGAVSAASNARGEATVSWPAYTAKPFLQYDIYLAEGSGTPRWTKHTSTLSATSYTLTGLTPGQTYTVGVRVSQSSDQTTGTTTKWVRSTLRTTTVKVGGELFSSTAANAFVDTAGNPVIVNGVNIKKGTWAGGNALDELEALGTSGAPNFNAVRIVMEWSTFQQGPTTFNEAAFTQLDAMINKAKEKGLYVILDPIHAVTTTSCNGTTAGSTYHVPQWAWAQEGVTTKSDCTISPAANGIRPELDMMDNVLADPSTTAYLQHILARYNPATTTGAAQDRARQVIAIDLVNEPHSSDEAGKESGLKAGSAPARMQQLVRDVYGPWLAPTGPASLRAVNPDKILIIEPITGSGSLAKVDLSAVAKPNVVMSLHDYFGKSLNTDTTMGMGYSEYGYVAIERTDNWSSGAPAYVGDPEGREAQHREFVTQYQNWAKAAGLPLYVGEYGIVNAQTKGSQTDISRYATDTAGIYRDLGLSRTTWTHGNDGGMQIWNGSYFPQAFLYAEGKRP